MRPYLSTLLLALSALAPPANGALFIVDTKGRDAADFAIGDGICAYSALPPVGSRCTLRAAVQEANAQPGADVILIPDGWTIVLEDIFSAPDDLAGSGDLDILDDVAIGSFAAPGDWPTVDGGGIDRVFEVFAPATLTLAQIRVTGGDAQGHGGQAGGAWIRAGAAGDFSNCRFFGNRGTDGAITNDGETTITDCTIDGNRGNSSSDSAALANTGRLEIVRSAIVANLNESAGLFNASGALLVVRNATISDNFGSGISSKGDLVLRNVTLTDHRSGAGLAVHQPGAFASPSIRNSIIAGNLEDCSISIPGGAADTAHPNLDGDGTCGFLGAVGGLPSTDPELGLLGLHGGTTPSRVPGRGSPAIEAGANASCQGDDQRGALRPLDGDGAGGVDCDLGAVEVLPCTGVADRVVSSLFLVFPIVFEACFTIEVGPEFDVLAGGEVTFSARDLVSFANGVTVHSGGELAVLLDPSAGSGVVLP